MVQRLARFGTVTDVEARRRFEFNALKEISLPLRIAEYSSNLDPIFVKIFRQQRTDSVPQDGVNI